MHDIFRQRWGADRLSFVIVEPELAPYLYASAVFGDPRSVEITEETLMAGLSCGEVSLLAWESLAEGANDFLTIPESLVAPTMRLLVRSPFGDAAVTAVESVVAGLADALFPALGTSQAGRQEPRPRHRYRGRQGSGNLPLARQPRLTNRGRRNLRPNFRFLL